MRPIVQRRVSLSLIYEPVITEALGSGAATGAGLSFSVPSLEKKELAADEILLNTELSPEPSDLSSFFFDFPALATLSERPLVVSVVDFAVVGELDVAL
jgi:hypothetical protein